MKKAYLKVRFLLPEAEQEILISDLIDSGFTGFEQMENILEAWIGLEHFSDRMRGQLNQWLQTRSYGGRILDEHIEEERNWNKEWEKSLQPITVGSFYICSTWGKDPPPDGKVSIRIDPKMAFGTGYHETTRLMLRMLSSIIREGDRVLDVGTGTGILAFAALKLGASHATGVDIDTWSYENALENARINGLSDRFDMNLGTAGIIDKNAQFEVILANINRNTLLDIAEPLTRNLSPDGSLLLSGITRADEDTINRNVHYASLNKKQVMEENEWIGIILDKDS
ncbi:MAG: 50S ribosomal protein L11 methyltransferase [Balneolales bacterium]